MHMISLQNSRESGQKLQDDTITKIHQVTYNMLVDTSFQYGL